MTIDDEDEFTCDYLKSLEKKYKPKQILIEYNGMWGLELFFFSFLSSLSFSSRTWAS